MFIYETMTIAPR